MSAGRLFWVQRDGGVVEIPITKDRIVIGRGNAADVKIPIAAISTQHAAIVRNSNGISIEDLKSTNGTRVNGRRVENLALKHGDQIEVGTERLVFFTDATLPPSEFNRLTKAKNPRSAPERELSEGDPTLRQAPRANETVAAPGLGVLDAPYEPTKVEPTAQSRRPEAIAAIVGKGFVTILSGRMEGKRFPLVKEVTTLGQEGFQVYQIVYRDGAYWAMRGQNSTPPFVNGRAIDAPRGLRLAHNDKIELGGAAVRFEIDAI